MVAPLLFDTERSEKMDGTEQIMGTDKEPIMGTDEMENAMDFLDRQARDEIVGLKTFLDGISSDDILNMEPDDERFAEIFDKLFFTMDGLRKIGCALEFLDAYRENGSCPTLTESPGLGGLKNFQRYYRKE